MSLLRKLALVFSLVLVVALTVGYFFRRAQLGGERDSALTASAELAAERVGALATSVEVAARAGSDPGATLASVVGPAPELGGCVVTDADYECGGNGPAPTAAERSARIERRLAGLQADRATIDVRDGILLVTADGDRVSVLVAADPASLFDAVGRNDVRLWATDEVPAGARLGEFVVAEGMRQTAIGLPNTTSVYIVAATADAVSLPSAETNLFLVVGVLAALLLMLAGFTAFFDQRNLVERASTDQLTRLPNRSEFERRIAELITASERNGRGFALLLFDLDGFKRSTTPTAIRPAMRCCRRSPSGSPAAPAAATSSPGGAATSSWSPCRV